MNNLDPEVAERPDDLVVYGGIGRAARNWDCYDRIVQRAARARRRRDAAGPVGQARRRVPHPRRCAARADREFQPRRALVHLGPLQRARSQGTHDVRPDDGRLVDLHRQPGHRAGHVRDVRRNGSPALRRQPRGQVDPDRGARRHGRCATARGDDGRRVDARRSNAGPSASRSGSTRATSTSAPRRSTRRSRSLRARVARRGRSISVGLLGNAAEVLPELLRRGVRPDAVTDQTSAHDPINGYLPEGWTLEQWDRTRQRPACRRRGGAQVDGDARARDARVPASSAFRSSITATTSGRLRWTRARRTRLRSRVSCRPTCVRFSAAASGRSAGSRSPAIPRTSTAPTRSVKELIPDDRAPAPLARHGARHASSSRACRRASAGSASVCATSSASPSTRWSRAASCKAPIVIGRDHLDSGSVASPESRNRSHARRLRCGGRLATAQRVAEHGQRRDVGIDSPRRRRRHRLLAACRRRDRLRWHGRPPHAASSACSGTIRPRGVMRHADAGYEIAVDCARENGLNLPFLD